MTRSYAEVFQARAKELDADRGKYQLAKAEAAALGSAKHREELLTLFRIVASYRAGDSGEKAIYLLAQTSMRLLSMVGPLLIMEQFEAREADFNKLSPPVE